MMMSKQMKLLSSRMELAEFNLRLIGYAKTLKRRQRALQNVSTLFSPGRQLLPLEFEDAVKCIATVGEYSKEFSDFIEDSSYLPLYVVPLRLSLLVALQHANVQIVKLKQLLDELNAVNWTSLHLFHHERLIIHRELEKLRQLCKEILTEVDILLNNFQFEKDRERFPKRLYSVV